MMRKEGGGMMRKEGGGMIRRGGGEGRGGEEGWRTEEDGGGVRRVKG